MKPTKLAVVPLVLLFAVVSTGAAPLVDDAIDFKSLPAKVVASVKAKFPKAVWKKAYKEVEESKTLFEIEAEESGKRLDLAVTPEGVISEIERELDPKRLAKPLLSAIAAKFPGSIIKSAEAVETLEDGKIVKTVGVTLIAKDKEAYDVVLSPEGKILSTEEAEEDEDEKKDS